jgi:predicted RNA-binding Zn-ribbon protein involved in translation (DUF1610 family)
MQIQWTLGVNDPTIIAWVIALLYLIAAVRCIYKAKASKQFGGNYQFWLYLAAFLFLLGINKQLDLQSLLAELAQDSAKAHGWYAIRKPVQIAFIALLGVGMLITILSFRMFLASTWHNYKITWLGIILLNLFILLRAMSFQHFDMFINRSVYGINFNELLEICAILLIILGTFLKSKQANPLAANAIAIKNLVVIKKEGDIAQCPQCGTQPLAKTADGRKFKCRSCSYKFTVSVVNL